MQVYDWAKLARRENSFLLELASVKSNNISAKDIREVIMPEGTHAYMLGGGRLPDADREEKGRRLEEWLTNLSIRFSIDWTPHGDDFFFVIIQDRAFNHAIERARVFSKLDGFEHRREPISFEEIQSTLVREGIAVSFDQLSAILGEQRIHAKPSFIDSHSTDGISRRSPNEQYIISDAMSLLNLREAVKLAMNREAALSVA